MPVDRRLGVDDAPLVIRAATGHRWLLVLALLASALAIGAASPQNALAAADLALTVTDTPDPAVLGDTLTIAARVTNNGNETAYEPAVAFGTITNATLASTPGCQTFLAIFASCGLATLAPGATRSVTITLDNLKLDSASLYANATSADIDGNQVVDPTPADNQVNVTTAVEQCADLKLDLTAVSPVTMGNTSTVTAAVTNTLAGVARESVLQVVIPPELPLVSVPEGCTGTALKVTCSLGAIGSQVTVSRAITLSVPTEGSFILLGTASSSRPDPTPIDSQGQVTITGLSPIDPTDNGPPPTTPAKPTLRLPQAVPIGLITSGVPSGRRCVRGRTLRFRLRRPSGISLMQADIYVGKRRVRRLAGSSLTKSIVLRSPPRGRYTVIVVASLRDGGRLSGRRVLKVCR